MQSNPQAREDFNVVTRDIGVPNTMILDNAGKQVLPQIELQEFIRRCCIGGIKMEPYSCWYNISKGVIKYLSTRLRVE